MTQYGVSYFGVRDPRHAARDLDEIAGAGFRHLTHTLSEYDLRYHFEDVARLVTMSRDRGLEVGLDPWGVGGIFGTIMIAVFGAGSWTAQLGGLAVVGIFTVVVTVVLIKLVALITPLRVSEEQEFNGLDITAHGESAYDHVS